jgi:crotonobetainyl-CoA:carnitine CoA-transferase CaiB-like acyl-CoA transferase
LRSAAPALGQHTRLILESIGYDAARVAALANEGVIKEG